MPYIREYGVIPGDLSPGERNSLTDVDGVRVGHCTVTENGHRTGVTVIVPQEENPFLKKLTAACYVHNGFGKTCGLMQIEELGTLETPIVLTNTLNVGLCSDALVSYTLRRCRQDGVDVSSLNPVVGECNDSRINPIAERAVREEHVWTALENAHRDFQQGDVGAGAGTVCYGLKGGIGSASRCFRLGKETYTVGVLVQSNYGATRDFMIQGRPIGKEILCHGWQRRVEEFTPSMEDRGSIMMILATDLPLSARQLRRLVRRAPMGLGRLGSFTGHGSGEVVIGFTTQNPVFFNEKETVLSRKILREDLLNLPFQAAAEATEEAVLNSLTMAHTVKGQDGKWYVSLADLLPELLRKERNDTI
ncbi:MAG: P1 family peptidase [Clostridia bacterium]|nr:P1 family peptidase [Clostridia bacterium]MDD7483774.1 P1 family peptidase [Clostridia bacterium]